MRVVSLIGRFVPAGLPFRGGPYRLAEDRGDAPIRLSAGPRPYGSMSCGGRGNLRRDGADLLFEGADECLGGLAQPYAAGAEIFGEPPGRRPHPRGPAGEVGVGGVKRGLQDGDPRPDLSQRLFQHLASRVGHQALRLRIHTRLFGWEYVGWIYWTLLDLRHVGQSRRNSWHVL